MGQRGPDRARPEWAERVIEVGRLRVDIAGMRRLLLSTLLLACFAVPAAGSAAPKAGAGEIWVPPAGATFQWQLQGEVDTTVVAEVYDIDMFDSSKALIGDLHSMGRRVICYVSAGSYEKWRPDADSFPNRVLGKPLDGWPGERWLDVRKLKPLKRIMDKRVARCAAKGFDGIEYDNVDGFTNDTGFDLSKDDQLAYLEYLSQVAHDNGLAAGLKNLPQLAKDLEPNWDFAVNEQCFQYDECKEYSAFIDNDKAVFHVEYEMDVSEFCDEANEMGFTSMRKKYSLKAWRQACWEQ